MNTAYLILLIPTFFFAILVFMLFKQRKIDVAHKEVIDEIDNRIEDGFLKLKTSTAFVKQGYTLPKGERVVDFGDDFMISEDTNGKLTIIPLGEERIH